MTKLLLVIAALQARTESYALIWAPFLIYKSILNLIPVIKFVSTALIAGSIIWKSGVTWNHGVTSKL